VEFLGVRAGAVRGKGPVKMASSCLQSLVGTAQALIALRRLRPDVVLTTGGFVSVPVALGARMARIPLVVFLPDVRPGLAVRVQARFAALVACAFETDPALMRGARAMVVTGYPVRARFGASDPQQARRELGLSEGAPVVLVYGGSQGSRSINDAVLAQLDLILAECQLIHICGPADLERLEQARKDLTGPSAARYHLSGFLGDRLALAMAAADLCVSRAGASTLAELPTAGLPAIVVPGPFSDQAVNAAYLAERGAAVVLEQDSLSNGGLVRSLRLVLSDSEGLKAMSIASRALARPQAASSLSQELSRIGAGPGRAEVSQA
ncbi:MAG: UDP-N-acetylglucosamine--N-acetylmuramyl-(pentapeptide) pyrophosphoryl-undecaprenol N-acetylglucosamine transferase, partial [Acidimicrobiales bacterium]